MARNHFKSSFPSKGTNRLCFSPWAVTETPWANILKDVFQALSLCTTRIFPVKEYCWLHLQKELHPQPWALSFSTSPHCTLWSPALTSQSCGFRHCPTCNTLRQDLPTLFFQAEGSVDPCALTSNFDRTQQSLRLIFLQGHDMRSRPPLQLLWKIHGEKQHVSV